MSLLNESEQRQVGDAITRIERDTDAEVVTVLARQADDYTYIPLLWAGLTALIVPGALSVIANWLGWLDGVSAWYLLLVQWLVFIVLAVALAFVAAHRARKALERMSGHAVDRPGAPLLRGEHQRRPQSDHSRTTGRPWHAGRRPADS